MKPFTRSIIELFDGKKRFLIPLYQRQYAWRVQPQLELLWDDIERAVDRIETDRASLSPHFMGAIVVAQVKTFGKQVQAFEIIDGQQRLTTFQLLIAALRDVAAANGSPYANELEKYLLNDGVMEKPDVERFKLWPSLTDRRAFAAIIAPATDLDAIAAKPIDEDGFVRRAVAAHEWFKAQITAHVTIEGIFDEDRLETMFEALKEGLAAVSIELEGGDDPQTIFETLNSRGVDLTSADLMRNFIFQRAKGLGQSDGSLIVDKLYEQHWLPLDRAFWLHQASRGRQTRQRLEWMLTDHLSMHTGEIVSVETLFEGYRRWILNTRPFASVPAELASITATAAIERRLFEQHLSDPIGDFGRFADAFDVSTAMPLVIYLATEAQLGDALDTALSALKSYILRRDICGLTTKNYNRFFVAIVSKLRQTADNKADVLLRYLADRQLDIDRWPDDTEWRRYWISKPQYKGPRQPRLRYLFEAIEKAKRSGLSEDIEIKSTLTIEHIMPQAWQSGWPISGFEHVDPDAPDEHWSQCAYQRNEMVNTLGNLTLLTQALNSSVSNGPYKVKMPAVRSHSSLALNRELHGFDHWNEDTIRERGAALFEIARKLWQAPNRAPSVPIGGNAYGEIPAQQRPGLPPEGTYCRFTYGGSSFTAVVNAGSLVVEGVAQPLGSFSAASRELTGTSRNGWHDWYLRQPDGEWVLADDWRTLQGDPQHK